MKKKYKKIAFVTPIYLPANLYGSDNAVRILAEAFVDAGYDVSVITSNALTPRYWYDPIFGKKISRSREVIHGVKIYRLFCDHIISSISFILGKSAIFPKRWRDAMQIIGSGPYLIGFFTLLQKENFDVLHCSPFPLNINKQVVDSVEHLDKKPRVILTPFFHSRVLTYHNRQFAQIIQKADIVHVVSLAEKHDINNIFPSVNDKTEVIPLFLRLNRLHSNRQLKDEVDNFKTIYQLHKRIVILFAGLKGHMKGALDVLSAMQSLHKNDSRFLFIAIGHNTQEWTEAIRNVPRDILLDFHYVDERTKEIIFGASDIFCMPSVSESFGFVYLEAWHKKKPVIAANISAIKELVGEAGILVPYHNTRSLISAIEQLGYNQSMRTALGENGYRRLHELYDISRVFPSYKKLFSYEK